MPHQSNIDSFNFFQMDNMAQSLVEILDRTDIVGYVAARNMRSLNDELEDFRTVKNKLIVELGSEELDEDGNPTGNVTINVGTEEFDKFIEKINPIGTIKSNPTIFKLDADECIDKLSGSQMLKFDWMIDYGDGGDNS